MIETILTVISAVLIIYTFICMFNILMSWIPGLKFTAFGRFIYKITEPYMGFFSRMNFLHLGGLDFSPIVSIGLLGLASSILSGILTTGRIFFGAILASIFRNCWSICSSLITILFLLMLIRWIVLLIKGGQTSFDSGWNQIDILLNKFCYKIAGTFYKRNLNYQTALLISWISLLVIMISGNIIIRTLSTLCFKIPF